MSQDEEQGRPQGTCHGFADPHQQQPGDEQVAVASPVRSGLPPPRRARHLTGPASSSENDERDAPVLRRVEHELSEPPRFTAATQAGRPIMRDEVAPARGLQVVRSEELIKRDLLHAARVPLWRRALTAVAWTRGRLLASIACVSAVLAATVIVLVLRCGDDRTPRELASARLPPALPSGHGEAAEARAGAPAKTVAAGAARPDEGEDLAAALPRARKLLDQGFCPDAARVLQPLIAARPPSATVQFYLGRALVCQGRHRQGLAAYDKAFALDPRVGQHEELIDDLGFLLTQGPVRRQAVELAAAVGEPAELALAGAATSRDLQVRQRAVAALERIGATARIDWPTVLWLDLQQLGCDERPAVIDRIVEHVERAQALKLLRAALASPQQRCARPALQQAIVRIQPATKR